MNHDIRSSRIRHRGRYIQKASGTVVKTLDNQRIIQQCAADSGGL